MASAFHVVKTVAAWGFFVGAIVCLIVAPPMTVPMASISIAASLLPEA